MAKFATLSKSLGSVAAGVMIVGASLAAAAPAQAATAPSVWDKVAQCESGGNWKINTGNGYYGGLQFSGSTWRAFGGGSFAPYAHQASKAQQIQTAQKVLKVQGPGAWPVCSRKAGLTRANGAAPVADTTTAPSGATVKTSPRASEYQTMLRYGSKVSG